MGYGPPLGSSSGVTVGTTTSDGTSNVLLKTDSGGKVNNSTLTNPGAGVLSITTNGDVQFGDVDGLSNTTLNRNSAKTFKWRDNAGNIDMTHDGSNLRVQSGDQIGFSSSATDATTAADTGLSRSAAAVVKFTNGAAGSGSFTAASGTFDAGTTTVAPINFTSGTNLTTAVAGAMEYDGKVHYATPNASNRAVNGVIHFTSNQSGAFTMANTANAQSPFLAANDVITLPAATTYLMEGLVQITGMGGTTRTTALEFDAGGATLTSISYFAEIWTGAAQTIATASGQKHCIAATAQVLNATVATAAATIRWRGIVRINGAGTFIPQVKFSADPTGTIVCSQDSYFLMTPLGSNTVAFVGNWA